jgi:hypothetical protein
MNCDVTIKAEDFKTIHNALWELQYRDGVDVDAAVEKIRGALEDAYAQDSNAFERKNDHYSQIKSELGLRSIWSIYEVDNLNERHPYPNGLFVTYKDHWGKQAQHCAVYGDTWADLYRAADNCICNSGDEHHVFIERFTLVNGALELTTGS